MQAVRELVAVLGDWTEILADGVWVHHGRKEVSKVHCDGNVLYRTSRGVDVPIETFVIDFNIDESPYENIC